MFPLAPGLSERRTHDYKRAGITTLFAALEVATGRNHRGRYGQAAQLRTGSGAALTVPVSFQDLCNRFGDSWRVASSTSLLNDCGQATAAGRPTAPFTVHNVDPQTRQSAQAVCRQAGVTDSRLLDPSTLDVATIGSSEAAAYVGMRPPVLVNN